MTKRLCRLCWNEEGWHRPTGSAAALESKSFVADNGFGHEEWLFNADLAVDGQRVGFIQGISKARSALVGQTLDIVLYARNPLGAWCKVGQIQSAQVLDDAEAHEAVRSLEENGVIDSMEYDLARLDIRDQPIRSSPATAIANVRFDSKDCHVLDPPEPFPNQQEFGKRFNRYSAYRARNIEPAILATSPRSGRRPATSLKSGRKRERRAVSATEQDPKHNRIQNDLLAALENLEYEVEYEPNWIDLYAVILGKATLFEIKTTSTAKRCIREALGQLLEYAHYPSSAEPARLVAVGDAIFTAEDVRYLDFLRDTYDLDLYYVRFDRHQGEMEVYPKGRFNEALQPPASGGG